MTAPPAHRAARPPGKVPDDAALRAAALAHLARYAATEAGLRQVLERRIGRWARATAELDGADAAAIALEAGAARARAGAIARRLAEVGAVDDVAFATARAARLRRGGKSRRAIAAHLGAKGVDAETAASLVPADAAAELDAALAWCRRRRAGPFGDAATDAVAERRMLAALARAGFGHATAREALAMDPATAAERLAERRR